MAHEGMPRPEALVLSKEALLRSLVQVDGDKASANRVLAMETEFHERIENHLESLPAADAKFARFNTNPFVLMFHTLQHGYTRISEIEEAILPAKVFSSMETSAGRMIEAVVLPQYGWEFAPSGMQTVNSAIDGKKVVGDTLCLATLKSGPRCLNDEMSENFADTILDHCVAWARDAKKTKLDITYGVLYGTRKQSNKKDWHILRNIVRKLPKGITEAPDGQWRCRFEKSGIQVTVTIRIGIELWNYIAGDNLAFSEIGASLLRACVKPSHVETGKITYTISDLGEIISLTGLPKSFNTKILQRSQLEWLFFFARHFCDGIVPGDLASLSQRR
jgi:Type II restriction endonuclease EcoO109I